MDYTALISHHVSILKTLQVPSGMFLASKPGSWYDKVWLRDNFYECLAFEEIEDWKTVEQVYDAIFTILLKYEEKIDWAINNKPTEPYQHIHARFDPVTFEEFDDAWGNNQHDAVGCLLFKIGDLEKRKPGFMFKNTDRIRITQKLVWYLNTLEYWKEPDNGIWEFGLELKSSSIGACVAGLSSVERLKEIKVPVGMIFKGQKALNDLLPRESKEHFVDLAQLSLIYPYHVISDTQRDQILKNLEYHLLRKRGVIRYKGDHYHNANEDNFSEEAEWTMGLSWLSIIYTQLGQLDKAKAFATKVEQLSTEEGLPESYYSNSDKPNPFTPLGWSESMFIVALERLKKASL